MLKLLPKEPLFFARLLLSVLGVIGVMAAVVPVDLYADAGKKKVLVLHSYHRGYLWTDDVTRGIDRILSTADFPVTVQFEFMDTKKIFDDVYQQQIIDLYRYKFRNQKFDVIISSDDNAFNFLRDHRDTIFPGTPVVYCGTNYITDKRAAELPDSTGVNEAASMAGNVDLILDVHPTVTHLAVVADATTTGRRVSNRIAEIMPRFRERVKLILLQDYSMAELEERLRELPANTVVLYTVYFRDRTGKFFSFDESIKRVTSASTVPVYVTWDFSLGYGSVGGLLTSGRSQGETAARLALRILEGETASSIPRVDKSPNVYMFDYNVLQRYGINRQLLPPNALVRNMPDELYTRYKTLIWRSAGVAAVLIVIIMILMTNILRRRRAEAALQQTNEALEERVRLRTKDMMLTNNRLNEEILEHKRSLDEIRKLSRAIEHSPSAVIILDGDLRVEYVNPRFTERTGYTFAEVEKEGLSILRGEPGDTDYAEKAAALKAGREWKGEFYNRRKDGTLYFEVAAMAPVFDEEGKLAHYVSVNEDVTEKKKAEETLVMALSEAVDLSNKLELTNAEVQKKSAEIEEAYEQLKATQSQMLQQEKMASIGQLAAGVAHEINNPMGFISGNLRALGKYVTKLGEFVSQIQDKLADSPEVPESVRTEIAADAKKAKIDYILDDTGDLVEESLEGADRVKEIVQGLKTFSRVDQAERKPVDLHECLESTINIVWNEIKYKATLEKDFGDLPLVDCYPQQLNQVFMNVLVNGAQAIESQGTISVRTRAEGEKVSVSISDTGCGIPEDKIGRIFEPFFTTKEVGKGTGLGMSIAYDIVQRHGGDIRIDSTLGEGTTFTIELPVTFAGAEKEEDG